VTPDLPRGPKALVNKAASGWTHRVHHATGTVEATTYGEPRGDGTRPKITVEVSCKSIGIRFDHPDGRAAVATWARREDATSFAFAGAQRGRHPDENVPVTLNATELGVYLSGEREDED
jgi:hypothetical protein